jgi:hypothetical protein
MGRGATGLRHRLTLRRQRFNLPKLGHDLLGFMPFPAHLKSSSMARKPCFREDHFSGAGHANEIRASGFKNGFDIDWRRSSATCDTACYFNEFDRRDADVRVIRPLLGTEHRRSTRAVRVYRMRLSRNRVALSRRMPIGVSASRAYPT